MSSTVPSFSLNTGAKMPAVGMGCWLGTPGGGERVYKMCSEALKAGYRHFDTAAGYANEAEVGRAIRDSGVPRSEVFVTTKLWSSAHHRVSEAFDASFDALGLDYVDLYLMHWPQALIPEAGQPLNTLTGRFASPTESPTFNETWADMEKLLDTGKVKAIGISNFQEANLKKLLITAKVIPAANQMESHPSLPLHGLKALCDKHDIRLVAYSPLGQPKPGKGLAACFEDQAIVKAAQRTESSAATVALSWGVQRGVAVIPKSETPARIESNLKLVTLTDEEIKAIDEIHTKPDMHRSLVAPPLIHGGKIFGWTLEQMGFGFDDSGVIRK